MKVRRSFLVLAIVGLILLGADTLQRWAYVRFAEKTPRQLSVGRQGPLTAALLVAGQGLDDVETATSLRDISNAHERLVEKTTGRLALTAISPGQTEYSNNGVLEAIRSLQGEELVIYFSGHGGGKNFGAVGGLNIRRDQVAEALGEAEFKSATVIVDCCWSGDFTNSFENRNFPGKVTLITSTDAQHPSPFPVSFLSPRSFGHMFFDRWGQGTRHAFDETNRVRERLDWLYDEKFGLKGTITTYP